jgi:hypothetical protein
MSHQSETRRAEDATESDNVLHCRGTDSENRPRRALKQAISRSERRALMREGAQRALESVLGPLQVVDDAVFTRHVDSSSSGPSPIIGTAFDEAPGDVPAPSNHPSIALQIRKTAASPKSGLAIAINVRLKQMRELAKRRGRRGLPFDKEAWLRIYAEGVARRYSGVPLKTVILHDIKIAEVDIECECDIDAAMEIASRAVEVCPDRSAYASGQIGRLLGVTLAERIEFASHLGCCEETKAQKTARLRQAKTEQNALRNRRSGRLSQEKQVPWAALGISRRTWFYRKAANQHKSTALKLEPIYKYSNQTMLLQKQCNLPPADDALYRDCKVVRRWTEVAQTPKKSGCGPGAISWSEILSNTTLPRRSRAFGLQLAIGRPRGLSAQSRGVP